MTFTLKGVIVTFECLPPRILERLHAAQPAENTYVSLTSDSLYTSLQVYRVVRD